MIRFSITNRKNDQLGISGYYANVQYTDIMTLEEFAQHIRDHGSVYDKADIMAVLTKAVSCIRELILEGYRIKLGDFGTFYATITSTPADSADEFTTDNIKTLKCKLQPGADLLNLRDDAEFTYVLTRSEEAAALAAAKAGTSISDALASEE